MKTYLSPRAVIIWVDCQDVITASGDYYDGFVSDGEWGTVFETGGEN